MKKISIFVLVIVITSHSWAQTEKFDIASFIPPQGWQRMDSNGVLAFHDLQTNGNLTSFCQIALFPSKVSSGTASKDFANEWKERVVKTTGTKAKPSTQTAKTDDGWTVVTGTATITARGMTYACALFTLTGFGKVMSVLVNTAGGDYTSTIDKFLNDLNLDANSTAAVNPSNNNPRNNQPSMAGPASMNSYDFTAPEGWLVQKNKDNIKLQNKESGCFIMMLEPQPSSGNLEQDAKAVFELMYQGWKYQNSGEKQYTLTKGYLVKGLEYCMMEAQMGKLSADGTRYDGYETGAAMVVKAGAQIVILSIRHNTSLMGHNDCDRKYETMGRFFNSFTVKNIPLPQNTETVSSRIVGKWGMMESGAIGEYIFAANGHYAFAGAVGNSYTTSDFHYEYLHIKTYSWDGDGSYSFSGNQLTMKKRNRSDVEQVTFRFEKVNHGGTGWTDRLYMLSRGTYGENEVRYEKKEK